MTNILFYLLLLKNACIFTKLISSTSFCFMLNPVILAEVPFCISGRRSFDASCNFNRNVF